MIPKPFYRPYIQHNFHIHIHCPTDAATPVRSNIPFSPRGEDVRHFKSDSVC